MNFFRGLILLLLAVVLLLINFFPFSVFGHLAYLAGIKHVPYYWYIKLWPLPLILLAAWFMFFREDSIRRLYRNPPEHHPYLRFMNRATMIAGVIFFYIGFLNAYFTIYSEFETLLGLGVLLLALGLYIEDVTVRFQHWDNGLQFTEKTLGSLSIFSGFLVSFWLIILLIGFIGAVKEDRG